MLDRLDLVLVMTVNPGLWRPGLHRGDVRQDLARPRHDAAANIDLQVDGGLSPATAGKVAASGADVLVAGSAIFKGGAAAYAANIEALRRAAIEGAAGKS